MLFMPFFIRLEKKLVKIYPEEVLLLVTEGNYTRLYLTEDKQYYIRSSLATALKKLPDELFVQINRNCITSILYIESIYKDYIVVAEKPLSITRPYYKAFVKKLNVIE